jgi:putative ABC transport system substrate-binding protein
MEAKRIGLLREVAPQATTLGVLLNPNNPTVANQQRDIEEAARAVGLRVMSLQASTASELDAALTHCADRIPALLVTADAFFTHRATSSRFWRHEMPYPRSTTFATLPWPEV